jgi:hypothetical protein
MLPTMLTLWGVVTTLQGITRVYIHAGSLIRRKGALTSYEGLLVARFFIGLLEGKRHGFQIHEV